MHKWLAALAIVLLILPALPDAQEGGGGGRGGAAGARGGGPPAGGGRGGFPAAPPRPVAGNGVELPGWWARLDDPKESRQGLNVTPASGGIHAVTGPNAIFFDPQQDWEGDYTVRALFTLNKPASHPVAYGLFFGGIDLDQDDQRYAYFVIRQDGRFQLRKRTGATVANLSGDWMEHPAVARPDASGRQVNELAIRVRKDGVTFLANGQEVARQPSSAVDLVGIAGLRIGHGLDVQVDKFAVINDTPRSN
jgi:hypothetical protein